MQFINDYLKAIDVLALVAVVGIAVASFSRIGSAALLCGAAVVAIWGAIRVFGL